MQRLKTIEVWHPLGDYVPANTFTALTQQTIYIPESNVSFRSVHTDCYLASAEVVAADLAIAGFGTRVTLQGASANDVINTTVLTTGGEDPLIMFSANYTNYFNDNWSGTSMTYDASVLANTANASGIGYNNASLRTTITYEYDDSSTTQIKTVWIPLNANTNLLGITKPSTPQDVIPALDTYCPEASKVFRQKVIVIQGNEESAAATDRGITIELDTAGPISSNTYESFSAPSRWYRMNFNVDFDTSTTHNFYMWATTTDFDHPQVWLVVTYEYNVPSTTTVLNSVLLPMEFAGGMGGPTSADFQSASRDFWIQEPETITLQRAAFMLHYETFGAISGMNARMGSNTTWQAYSSVASVVCGGCGFMIRDDGAITLSRGKNTLNVSIYNTDTIDCGWNVCGWWMLNYTSGVATDGPGSHNHTVVYNLFSVDSTAGSRLRISDSVAMTIPETNHFKNSIGVNYVYTLYGGTQPQGLHVGCEKFASEGGNEWMQVYETLGGTDPENGVRQAWATSRDLFYRFKAGSTIDAGAGRVDPQVPRRWRTLNSSASIDHLDLYLTYHTISYNANGTISGSSGGTVDLTLIRDDDGDRLMETSRTGNGAYNFTWFDNTANVYVTAYESDTLIGRSPPGKAS